MGGVALIAPAAADRALGVNAGRRVLRLIGVVDLGIATGLHLGQSKSLWLMARAASNPPIAAVAALNARSIRARLIAAGLLAATIMDLRMARRMRGAVDDLHSGRHIAASFPAPRSWATP
jgi:hypothetical protein